MSLFRVINNYFAFSRWINSVKPYNKQVFSSETIALVCMGLLVRCSFSSIYSETYHSEYFRNYLHPRPRWFAVSLPSYKYRLFSACILEFYSWCSFFQKLRKIGNFPGTEFIAVQKQLLRFRDHPHNSNHLWEIVKTLDTSRDYVKPE